MVAESARAYLVAVAAGSAEERAAALRDLCAALARLLGRRLAGEAAWGRWRWVDDILPESAPVMSPTACEVWGLAIWGEDGGREQWVEPFAASLRLADGGALEAYRLRFVDAAAGLGRVPYGTRRRSFVRDAPPEWQFDFTSPAA